MKKLLCVIIIILLCSSIFIGCSNHTSKKDIDSTKSISNTKDSSMVFVKLPSPPKCKKTDNAQIINKVIDFIDKSEKVSIANEDINGWYMLIKISTSEGLKEYSIVGNTLIIDKSYYQVSQDFIDNLEKIYNDIDSQEEKYIT